MIVIVGSEAGEESRLVEAAHKSLKFRSMLRQPLPAAERLVTLLLVAGGFLTIESAFYRPSRAKSFRMNAPIGLPATDSLVFVLPKIIHCSQRSSRTALHSTPLKFQNFDSMLDAFRDEPVLIYFTSMACGPCKLQKKELSTVQETIGVNAFLKVLTIDTERFPQVGIRYGIGKLPCLIFIKKREVLLRLEGLTKAEDIVEYLH